MILGVDWLSRYKVTIPCRRKKVETELAIVRVAYTFSDVLPKELASS